MNLFATCCSSDIIFLLSFEGFVDFIALLAPPTDSLIDLMFELFLKLSHKVDKFEGNSEYWEIALYNVEKFREFIPKNKKQLA